MAHIEFAAPPSAATTATVAGDEEVSLIEGNEILKSAISILLTS